jgi:hypothetical protein
MTCVYSLAQCTSVWRCSVLTVGADEEVFVYRKLNALIYNLFIIFYRNYFIYFNFILYQCPPIKSTSVLKLPSVNCTCAPRRRYQNYKRDNPVSMTRRIQNTFTARAEKLFVWSEYSIKSTTMYESNMLKLILEWKIIKPAT